MVFQTSKLEPSVRVACDYGAPSCAAAHIHFLPLHKYSMCPCANTICSTVEIQLLLMHKYNSCCCTNATFATALISLIVNLIVNDDTV